MKLKKLLFLTILFLYTLNSNAQSFKFNKLVVYESSKNTKERSIFCKSGNDNYFLKIYNTYYGQEAQIYDLENRKVHHFEVTNKTIEGNQNEYNFKYKDSRIITEKYESHYFFDYVKISEDSIYNYSKLIAYKNKSKKKIVYEIELKIRKNKSSYFSLYRFCMMHTYEYNMSLNFDIGGIIETSKIKSDDLIANEIILTNFEDFDLELVVPKEIIIK